MSDGLRPSPEGALAGPLRDCDKMRDGRPAHARPGERNQPLSSPTRRQPGRLAPVGSGGAGARWLGEQIHPTLRRVFGLPLVPCHGPWVLRGRDDRGAHERALREHQGGPRRAARSRLGSASRRALASPGTASCWPPIPSPTARGPIPRPSWPSSSLRPLCWGCVASVPRSIYHPGKPLRVLVHQRSKLERRWLEENLCGVMPIGRIESIEPLRGEAVPDMAVALAGATQILVPRAGAPGSSSRPATPESHQCLRPSCRPAPAP